MNRLATTCVVFASVVFATSVSQAIAQNGQRRPEIGQARMVCQSVARLVASGGGSLLKEQEKTPEGLSDRVATWIEEHRVAVIGAGATPFKERLAWGVATTKGDHLFLHVIKWPKEGKLLIPRLHNSVKTARLFGSSQELKLKPNVSDWEITLPEKPRARDTILPVLHLELDAPAVVATETAPVVKPGEKGAISLHARYAIVHGEMLRFEPQPHKNTVGYWVKEKDWAEWSCVATKSGRYNVTLRYGCGDGQGGSDIELAVGETKLPFTVEATGGFQSWRDVEVGVVELAANSMTTVTAKPVNKANNAVMDIQQITLTPAE